MESTINRSGLTAATCSKMVSRLVSVTRNRSGREFRFGGDAGRPHLDLPLGLLARNVQHPQPGRHGERHLQHQGGLADAGVAAHQHDRAGHQAAAQHACKLADRDGDPVLGLAADLGQAARGGASAQATRGGLRPAGFLGNDLLDHAVERTALRALPHETGGDASALLADVTGVGFGFGHADIILSAI